MNELEKYYQSLQTDIVSLQESDDEGASREQLFTHVVVDMLSDAGETENTTVAYDEKSLGMKGQHKINGYAVSDDYETVFLFISIYFQEQEIVSVPKKDIDQASLRITNFFRKSIYGDYVNEVDESSPIFEFVNLLANFPELKDKLIRVKIYILTNGEYKGELPQNKEINGYQVFYSVFDIHKIFQLSEDSRLPIELDFSNFCGEHFEIPCLPANDNHDYKAYLAILPGKCLSKLYEEYGARLLEQNVRSFLQFTGKINKGIRETIKKEPHMFFAFNNGIAATADHIELDERNYIKKIRNLQIVNGGQTTASIYNTEKKDNADISNIFIQVKISVIEDQDQYSDIVSRISRYSNTQNKVNDADFSANNPSLVAIERLSRYILTPITENNNVQTYWFFERARGQYKTLRGREGFTKTRQIAFDKKYPKEHLFSKVELAKYENAYQEILASNGKLIIGPNIVVRGNEKNYAKFINDNLPSEKKINNVYFEDLIAKAILFKTAEKRYGTKLNDYNIGELRQVVVPYTISLLSYLTNGTLNLYKIWKNQILSEELSDVIYDLMKQVNQFILDKSPISHYIEWAKKEECWNLVKDNDWNFKIEQIKNDLFDVNDPPKRIIHDEINEDDEKVKEDIRLITSIPFSMWKKIEEWGKDSGYLDVIKQGWANEIAYAIKYKRKISVLDRNHALSVFDIVCQYNIELLEETDDLALKESTECLDSESKSEDNEINLDLLKRMVEWDRHKRVLADWKWKAMDNVVKGFQPLDEARKKAFKYNLDILKKRGFK